MNLFVSGFSLEITEEVLQKAFETFGGVASVGIFIRKGHGAESSGFGLVDMPSKREAASAIAGLNGHELNGQTLYVLLRQ